MMLENQRTTVETVSALRDAAHASKSTMSEMKITDVDQVLSHAHLLSLHTQQQLQQQPAAAASAASELFVPCRRFDRSLLSVALLVVLVGVACAH